MELKELKGELFEHVRLVDGIEVHRIDEIELVRRDKFNYENH